MIEFTKSYRTTDGTIHGTIADAQTHELFALLEPAGEVEVPLLKRLCETLVNSAEKVIDILSTKQGSKPKARAINGGRKRRTPTAASTQAQPT